ncbi:group II intron reverse transcriptase/maturase [Paenibacillus sp. 1A_MP2]|uniref:group II intron reverse transcriptase/maturase n=1 Tax=Paenibacillus sp. 1A_MP2 TaxID=3457495 RepID=UPI003FCED636
MAQKFDYPKSESEFRLIQDQMYALTKETIDKGGVPSFKGLLEIMASEAVILTAIHKLKANKGSETPGSDRETMRANILEKQYPEVITRVQNLLCKYQARPVRRVYIDKAGKPDKRPLGIPTIVDRIIQECIRLVIEPILEAQFFDHSYGFRPMRDAHMALDRIKRLIHTSGDHWVIEGDISRFFDNVNHSILMKQIWHMGIRDRRVLMIIKCMLKVGVMDEYDTNPLGTPQGGIISPLLANVYLHNFDQWITREWERKQTKHRYARHDGTLRALRESSNIKPAYLVRYADDWVIITDSKANAERLKARITRFLRTRLKLSLSQEKTLITNATKRPIQFVGFELKMIRGNARHGYVTKTIPNRKRLKTKVDEIHRKIKRLRYMPDKERLLARINEVNAMIRGVIQYYEPATWVNIELRKHSYKLRYAGWKSLKEYAVCWTQAKELYNLPSIHLDYTMTVPAIEYRGMKIGITSLAFSRWKDTFPKAPAETPFSEEGRILSVARRRRTLPKYRADELLMQSNLAFHILKGTLPAIYNFEYFLNRPYVFNRDKGKCRVCGEHVTENVNIHHIQPHLSLSEVNRVMHLATVHQKCHSMIHSSEDLSHLGKKIWSKILGFREKLKEI